MPELPNSEQASATNIPGRKLARYWMLGLLTLVAFLASVDRQAFAVLRVPIQQQLQASDGAMGFLMGSAFAVAQAIFMIPLARISDRANRRNVLAIALLVWSLATALSGLAGGFVTLLLLRMVVGASQAAQTPATNSLVADLVSKNRRGTAFMFVSVGTVVGASFGVYLAGLLSDRHSWQVAMLAVGLPGLIVAAALFLTVPEPPRSGVGDVVVGGIDRATTFQQVRRCFAIRTLPPFIIGVIALQGAIAGWVIWFPVFLMRVHGLSASEMGGMFGIIVLCGMLSAMWSGPVSDVLAQRGARQRITGENFRFRQVRSTHGPERVGAAPPGAVKREPKAPEVRANLAPQMM